MAPDVSYIPMVEYEVTLLVRAPYSEAEPMEWDWGDVTSRDDDVEFKSQRIVRTYNQDVAMPDNKDRFGRLWPDVSPNELCPECGQPDNCGDCDHEPLTESDVIALGGVLQEN